MIEAKGWVPLPLAAMALNEFLLCRTLDSHLSNSHLVITVGYFLLFSRIVAPLLSHVWLVRSTQFGAGQKGKALRFFVGITMFLVLMWPGFLYLGGSSWLGVEKSLDVVCLSLGFSTLAWCLLPWNLWTATALLFPASKSQSNFQQPKD
jgi:hypothetical protein